MDKDEAKELLEKARTSAEQEKWEEALEALQRVDAAFPNSARVLSELVDCLIHFGRIDEARKACDRLEALPGAEDVEELRARINDHTLGGQGAEIARKPLPKVASAGNTPAAENVFLVTTATAVTSETTVVTGKLTAGAFYSGGTATVVSPEGLPLLAPILRLGSEDAPVNMLKISPNLLTMLLEIEASHIVVGSHLTSKDTGSTQEATMIVKADAEDEQAKLARDPNLKQATSLINQRKFTEAKQILSLFIASDPNNFEAHRLLARVHLEGDAELNDPAKALNAIQNAYECGGHDSSAVLETLAHALAVNGQARHGLRYLERLYEAATDMDALRALGDRIDAYRKRFALPDTWQFLDGFGKTILESSDIEQIRKALAAGNIPADAQVRRNKIGPLQSMEDSLFALHPNLAKSSQGGAADAIASQLPRVPVLAGALVGLILGVVISGQIEAIPPLAGIGIGLVAGALVGLLLPRSK